MPKFSSQGCADFWNKWRDRFCDPAERRNYFSMEGPKFIWAFLYFAANVILFATYAQNYTAPAILAYSYWLPIARGFGQMLNFNCAIVLLTVARRFVSWLRTTWLSGYVPFDKNIVFHRYIAYVILFASVGHSLAHYFNYACCHVMYKAPSAYAAGYENPYGVTGHALVFIMLLMYGASTKAYRRSKNFTVFWSVHHLFIAFYAFLLFHGPRFWKWFIAPAIIYFIERMMRVYAGHQQTVVRKVHMLKSNVIHIELEKSAFKYRAGQYCFLNCPYLSEFEWHPFTISSAPEEETVSIHIRTVGDWTKSFAELLNPAKKRGLEINKWMGPDGKTPIVRLDGPYGAPAEDVFEYEHVMLIAAGIGVTPFSSILKHIRNRVASGTQGKLRHVWFYWINRDEGSWEWFSDILGRLEMEAAGFLEIHTFFTGELKVDDIRLIVFSSQEYTDRRKSRRVQINARALYEYIPQASDELELLEDDDISVLDKDDSGWWTGKNERTGKMGLFPANHVMMLDSITSLSNNRNRHYGRPVWDSHFKNVRQYAEANSKSEKPEVGVFFCGPQILSKELYKLCVNETKAGRALFTYHKENF